jgi:competence protein ComEC
VPGETGALLATLALGRGTAPSSDLTQAHRATGLSHLLAVSGAHAAMLAWLLGIGGHRRSHQLGAGRTRTVLALLVLFAYAAITGCEPPVLRTVVAFGLGALAAHLGRPLRLSTGLLTPALLTALVQPEALLGPSFLLSYAAVVGLALSGGSDGGLWQRWLLAPLRASFWATLMTAPLTLFWFGQLAPWTVLLTPVLAPVVGLLLLGSLIAATLGCLVPGAASPFGPILGWLGDLYSAVVRAADLMPWTPLHAPFAPPVWTLGLAGLAAALVVERWPNRPGIGGAAALLCTPHFLPLHAADPVRLRLFAIGHGQAALVQTADGRQLAIDCGSLQQPSRAARKFVQHLGARHLDLLVVTHADQDHHNGVEALVRQLPIARAVLPANLAGSRTATALHDAGTEVLLLAPGATASPWPCVRIAAPRLPHEATDNDLSLWVSVDIGPATALLTGDAEEAGVRAALAQGIAVPSDLLVLPHHGRPNPLGAALLRQVRPTVCFASAASGDGDTALGRFARGFGCDLWVTGIDGDVELAGGPTPRVAAAGGPRPLPRRDRGN